MIGYGCGMAAPVISSQTGVATNTPVYVSGALFFDYRCADVWAADRDGDE
jgi:hypothetical protein